MRSTFIAATAALVATAAAKSTTIVNNCDFPIYLFSVDADHNPQTPNANLTKGQSHTEAYRTTSAGGVSIKLAKKPLLWDFSTNSGPAITQLEYTLTSDNKIWYDISNVNCQTTSCPFQPYGMYLSLADPSCPDVTCPAGELTCHNAYTNWNDDWASLSCPDSEVVDSTFYACAASAVGSGSPAPTSAAASSAAATSAPASSTKAASSAAASSPSSSAKASSAAVSSAPASSAAPTSTAAPTTTSKANLVQAENLNNNAGGVFTTFVTQVVTVEAREAEPTAVVKRHEHHHRHAHPHHAQ